LDAALQAVPAVVSARQDALKHEVELVILRPQPNELLQGWRGRIAATSGLRSVRDVDAALLGWVLRKSLAVGDDLDFVQCAASALEVSLDEFGGAIDVSLGGRLSESLGAAYQ
jgi:hypothetical protein